MKTILILEDNAREMERLVKIVREQGAQNEVICAVNLEQAYHMAMEKSIDLFLLDIILDPRTSGDASGMKFADHIREVERYHFTPIILLPDWKIPVCMHTVMSNATAISRNPMIQSNCLSL